MLKASLIGLAGAAGGLERLESLLAAPGQGRWRPLNPKAAPSPRAGAVLAYDAARGVPVLFSGRNADADTWTWDGFTWRRRNPLVSPPARYGASFAYHPPTRTVVLFGGVGAKGALGDTWFWGGRTWQAYLGVGPRARYNASMAFDPITGSLLMCGGFHEASPLADVWQWDGTAWRISPNSNIPHGQVGGAGLAYSAAVGKLILFGGYIFRTAPGSDETFTWDGTKWARLAFSISPPGRIFPAMSADPAGKLILLFGGSDSPVRGDTWTFTGRWTQVTQTTAPSPRREAGLAPDPSTKSFLLFGGADGNRGVMGDTWAWGPY